MSNTPYTWEILVLRDFTIYTYTSDILKAFANIIILSVASHSK